MFLEILLLFAVIHSSTNCQGGGRPPSQVTRARAIILRAVPGGNPTERIGSVTFRQTGRTVTIRGTVSGLTPGLHGFHVHETGDLGNGCLASGPHYNPTNMVHGGPMDTIRHVGDLGNINTPPPKTPFERLAVDYKERLTGAGDMDKILKSLYSNAYIALVDAKEASSVRIPLSMRRAQAGGLG
ncbi:copper/zinc superoxide dismutase [Ancylostoma duodenale]|uniref:Copper/zinc superoxide dismutase n=1 Tax=Ancylostoma duodenale TaxID=51022 RepID=A0A0C2CQD9_9BILA|nr:copper/zinc superoxide dismutase [Ancylostoma duodenale]